MSRRVASNGSRSRRAVTLVELLLVLGLLVVMATIVWPVMFRPMADHRLRKAADVVRVEWSRARVKAMSTGETQVFRFAIDSNGYAIESQAGPEYVGDSMDASTGLGTEADTTTAIKVTEDTLPEKITFVSGETAEDGRAEVVCTDTTILSDAPNGWSDPILFYPDGTTSTATVTLKNEFDRTIELSLRGLTGQTTVGKAKNAEGLVP